MYRYFFLILSITVIFPLQLHSQKHDYNWIGGRHDGTLKGNELIGYTFVNFSDTLKTTFTPLKYLNSDINLNGYSCTFHSNYNGELLWYSNGIHIYNNLHNIMLNGDSINYTTNPYIYNTWNISESINRGYSSTIFQSVPIVSSNSNLSILLHSLNITPDGPIVNYNLQYSLINMSENNGEGYVLLKNKSILQDTLNATGFIRHANGKDWWYLTSYLLRSEWQTYFIDSNGIQTAMQFDFGFPHYELEINNYLGISPDGTKLVRIYIPTYNSIENACYMAFYHFNRCTGIISPYKVEKIDPQIFCGITPVISKNNRFLYFVSDRSLIYQCDLEATDIIASCQKITINDRKWSPFPTGFNTMSSGPDGRIYIVDGSSNNVMTVINRPNLPGTACDVYQDLFLKYEYFTGLPKNPNYRLKALPDGDNCITKFYTSGPAGVTVKTAPQGGWRMYTDKAQVLPDGPLTFVLIEQDGVTVHCTKTFLKNQFSLSLIDCDPLPGMEWYLYQDFATFARGIIE